MSFGGGVAGVVGFPQYIEDSHERTVRGDPTPIETSFSLISSINGIIGSGFSTPYDNFTLQNPSTHIAAIQARLDSLQVAADAFNPVTDLQAGMGTVVAALNTTILRSGYGFRFFNHQTTALGVTAIIKDALESFDASFASAGFTALGKAAPTTNWKDYLADAVTRADVATTLVGINLETLLGGIRTSASSTLAAALVAAAAAPTTDYRTYINQTLSVANQTGALQPLGTLSLETAQGQAEATNVLAAAVSALTTNSNPSVDYGLYAAAADRIRDLAGYFTDIPWGTVFSDVQTKAASEVANAISAAQSAVTSSVLTNLANKANTALATPRANRKRRFAGVMADIGAEQSSAFLMGLALVDAVEGERVDQVVAESAVRIYSQALGLRPGIFQGFLEAQLGTETADKLARDGFLLDATRAMVQLEATKAELESVQLRLPEGVYGGHVRAALAADVEEKQAKDRFVLGGLVQQETKKNSLINAHLRGYIADLETRLRAETTEKNARDLLVREGSQSMVRMLEALAQLRLAYGGLYMESFRDGYRQVVGDRIQERQLVSRHTQIAMAHRYQSMQAHKYDLWKALFETKRAKILSNREYQLTTLDHDVRNDYWDTEALMTVVEAISAPTGGGRTLPKQDKVEQTLQTIGQAVQVAASIAALV